MKKLVLVITISFITVLGFGQDAKEVTPESLAQAQLEAYNNHDIDAFLIPYADSVEIYTFPDQLIMKGLDQMRASYGPRFEQQKDLHCKLMNRMVLGNVVIDQEYVTGVPGEPVEVFAIYHIKDEKIVRVTFVRKE
ncbi:MAG: nuclear transport factor 2 family protein [Bacteroidota bacterium]